MDLHLFAKSHYTETKLLTNALNVTTIIEQSKQKLTFHNFLRKKEGIIWICSKNPWLVGLS